ncbi:hypothetical protein WICPIJ_006736 [Wickerhamomyces pijperi]|uniref:Porphobilinogen deaminase n=1 Tax=Wickerhamomyces pijperi TaxID=599730 RepID=A0A9P8Q3P9_WICPI|nr:hypothetical protein WICPIJ_006736 [Wickerhamomyces pijperi]
MSSIPASSYLHMSHAELMKKSQTNSTLLLDDDSMIKSVPTASSASSASNGFKSTTIPSEIHIGGRKSQLAVAQSLLVKAQIKQHFPNVSCPILALTTLGDQVQNKPLYSFGGKSLWTKELEILLLQSLGDYHKLDLIVHSLKDMPTNLPEEFELGCITKREDPSDALVMAKDSPYSSLGELPSGSIVGTSSVRRSSQLKRHYPHLRFESIRGNLQTRLRKLDDPETEFKCIILATAGLVRMGLGDRITERLNCKVMMHAVGQGALGIEIRKDDAVMKQVLKQIEDKESAARCVAERSLMRSLEGGCSVPIGVWTEYDHASKQLDFKGMVNSVNGEKVVQSSVCGVINLEEDDYKQKAEELGLSLAKKLIDLGAKEILDEINFANINEKDE